MNLQNLKTIFINNGCQKVYVKELAENDNSKNQVYLGGSFEVLNMLPFHTITADSSSKQQNFKASVVFHWLGEDGQLHNAPGTQLILYPQYPEVRLSGFLRGAKIAPSDLMVPRIAGRLLFLAVTKIGSVIGYVTGPNSQLSNEFFALKNIIDNGIFKVIELAANVNSRFKLLKELRRIHLLNWIDSKKLDANGNTEPCDAPQCGGYTLEAELGITPNARAEPDYLGWEIKQFGVKNFSNLKSSVITLFTPEPTGGYYHNNGVMAFVNKYGYPDRTGKPDREGRRNFGGVHRVDEMHKLTSLKMTLVGFDQNSGKMTDVNGRISLLDKEDNEAASWNFSSLLAHWNKKHEHACYVPSIKEGAEENRYKYGDKVILGDGTDFQLLLKQMHKGHIYYDPGIKVEIKDGKQKPKARSQFRIKSEYIVDIYNQSETIDLNKPFT